VKKSRQPIERTVVPRPKESRKESKKDDEKVMDQKALYPTDKKSKPTDISD